MAKKYSAPKQDEIRARWHGLFEAINHAEDMVCVIIATSYVDNTLALLLSTHFIESTLVDRLLDPNGGPIGTLMAKANVAYCLGLLTKEDRRNVELIGNIRNKFAHIIEDISFEDQGIQDHCDELNDPFFSCPAPPFEHLVTIAEGGARHRERSKMRFRLASVNLCTRITIAAASIQKCTPSEPLSVETVSA